MALKDTTFAESLNCWGEDSNLTLLSLSFNKERDVSATPKQGEVNPVWMLRFAQHDRPKVALRAVCHSERERGIQCVDASLRYASFSMTS
jgi:hypothetical protein